jgi:cysteine desulfurase
MPHYFDYHSHAPIDPRVRDALVRAFDEMDANPHSTHSHGTQAHAGVENARSQIARLLGGRPSEIVLTSGATEANNLVFSGVADHLDAQGRKQLLVSGIEHSSVIEAATTLTRRGFEVVTVPPDYDGRIAVEALAARISPRTGLISVGWANHEIGTVQDIAAISTLARSHGALMHSDLAQAAGKVAVDVSVLDLASVSAHKMHGPIGVGALFVARRLRAKMKPHLVGGGQEGGLRSGTVSAPMAIAFGTACELASAEFPDEAERVRVLRDDLRNRLSSITGTSVNGRLEGRLPGNLNICFDGVDSEALVMALKDHISVSTGSACSARSLEPSPVLLAIGLDRPRAETAIRIGLGRFSTLQQVEEAAAAITFAVSGLRSARSRS